MADLDYGRRNKVPRPLSESEKARLEEFIDSIHYSARYSDDEYEYRHVQLPKNMLKAIPKDYHDQNKGTLKLLWEEEWRALGITQVQKWNIASVDPYANRTVCRALDGSTTRYMNQNRIFCFSRDLSTMFHRASKHGAATYPIGPKRIIWCSASPIQAIALTMSRSHILESLLFRGYRSPLPYTRLGLMDISSFQGGFGVVRGKGEL